MGMKQTVDRALSAPSRAARYRALSPWPRRTTRIVYEGAFGTRDLAGGPDMTLDTVFWSPR